MFQKSTDDKTTNKDFPRGQVNGFADNLDFKKEINVGQKRKVMTTLRIFKKVALRMTTHLAHSIAAQSHHYTKAMARAKSPPAKLFGQIFHPL